MGADSEGTTRPRRSALYMPGANARALEKGRDVPADILIMDLEDGVAPEAKGEARQRIVQMVGEGGYGRRELAVRVNGAGTEWHEADIAAIATSGVNAIALPKVDDAAAVLAVVALMEKAGAPADMQIWCMIETARGVLNANAIASAHLRVGTLMIGSAGKGGNSASMARRCCIRKRLPAPMRLLVRPRTKLPGLTVLPRRTRPPSPRARVSFWSMAS